MADNDDLFADSDDDAASDNTDDLIASAQKSAAAAAAAAPKKRLQKKKASAAAPSAAAKKRKRDISAVPDTIGGGEDDSNEDGGGGKGLFDDSDDDDEPPKAKQPVSKTMSKRERMEALQAKKRQESNLTAAKKQPSSKKDAAASKKKPKEDGGAESDGEESFDSAQYVRTKEDNDFIDADDDDPDALQELYAEQHFGDDHPEMEEGVGKKKKKGGGGRKSRDDDDDDDGGGRRSRGGGNAEDDLDNPIMAAVHRMKRKKREQRNLAEVEEEAKEFIHRMERAAEDDLQAIKERRPAVSKLNMLPQVVDMLAKRDMIRVLLDHDVLSVCKVWFMPLSNGTLGNVTVRQELLQAIKKIQEINTDDLKRSEIGKVIMALYMHPDETPALKREMKTLIEQWSRPIFQKSGNMKDLEHVQRQRPMSTPRAESTPTAAAAAAASRGDAADLKSIIASGSRGAASAASSQGNRVRVPYSKGFQYTVRPTGKAPPAGGDGSAKGGGGGGGPKEGVRNNLVKRILEKGRPVVKNHRSANVSIEGRPTK